MAVYDPRPIKLIAIQKNTEIHTARIGVPVNGRILVHSLEPGMSRSREKAKKVRASACNAVNVTNLMIKKAKTVNAIPPDLPKLL